MKTKQYAIFLLIVGMIAIVSMGSVSAAVGDKYVNGTGGSDINDGNSWEHAYQTIQKGLDNVINGGIVNIAAGNYTGTGNTNLVVKNNTTISGAGEGKTIIDGNGTNRTLSVNSGQNVTVQNLTIQNSNNSAINNNGSLTVSHVTFKNNTAINGGAIGSYSGNLTVISSKFINNTASSYGGAIECIGGHIAITDSTFTGNHAYGGGAIDNYLHANASITGSTFIGNNATYGGAIFNEYANASIAGSNFISNNASYGGAIDNYHANASITGSTFEKNTARVNGSAIYVAGNTSNLTAKYNRFVNNSLSDVFVDNGTVDVRYNWWGTNFNGTNPLAALRIGVNSTNAPNVLYNPWLILNINAKPSTIYEGGFSVVAADLYTDSNGGNHKVDAALYPKAIPVTFTTDKGGLKHVDVVLNHGCGDAIFVPGHNVGIANVSAQVDNQKVTTQVLVKKVPKPIIKVTHKTYTIIKIVKIKINHKIFTKIKIVKITVTKITIIKPHIEPAPV